MCGIIAVVGRPPTRQVPSAENLIGGLDAAIEMTPDVPAMAAAVRSVDEALRGLPGVLALSGLVDIVASLTSRLDRLDAFAVEREHTLDANVDELDADDLEVANAELIQLKDALWAVRNDRFRTVREVEALAGRDAPRSALGAYLVAQQAFSALDRLEVRGRDSAGIHLFVRGHDIEPGALQTLLEQRGHDPLFESGSVVAIDSGDTPVLSFVYKKAAEIGELGDNTAALRRALVADSLFRRAVSSPGAEVSLLGHTRWASVGIISEPNTHPLNSEEAEQQGGVDAPYVVAALNGDVDNHGDLRVEHGLHIARPITTDAKVIPTIASRHLADGVDLIESFRRTVSSFDGSVAIGAMAAERPDTLLLALRGSGQGLYVGLGDDCYIVASEPYGVVEETERYVRLDGEHGGEIVVLDAATAGEFAGIRRISYDGGDLPVGDDDVHVAEVTTRDIDRGDAPHYLLKEIGEAPNSFAKTLRGKIAPTDDGGLRAVVGARALPDVIAARLADGTITRIRVIGQGTAAVAGQSTAAILDELTDASLDVDAITATELSGFNLRLDMSDTLAIAVSQSGTTTDTNRTVDLIRARGGMVIGIVNRRGSDLTDKADGVMYTSDGRDVEMSVASTKAFYAQVAAGALLACAIAEAAGGNDAGRRTQVLSSLRALPDAMRATLERRNVIADAARRLAPPKRYWAVVGNGPNKVAAEEVRIKLSELCYKSMACDSTEDKKHIDLSSEPLILVCAAGLQGSTADDVAKEVAIFKAHKATPIVFANDGDSRYQAAAVIEVPIVDPSLGFVLSAMAGHLFGYEAALAIDASAHPLRAAREAIEHLVGEGLSGDEAVERLRRDLQHVSQRFHDGLRSNLFDGHLEASTAVRLSGMFRDLLSDRPVEAYQESTGKVATPSSLIDDLVAALTSAIEELTRPVDTIKHQAKTVTVGISRSDEGIIDRPLVQAVLAAGAGRDVLSYRTLKVLADLDPAVADVRGFTRYDIDGDALTIIDRGGISRDLPSRVRGVSVVRGTKHRVANEREVLVAKGRSDGRTVIFVPEVKAGQTTGITLLHVAFHDTRPAEVMRGVLQGYDRRYDRLVDWVSETEGVFDESLLATIPVHELLIGPISATADHWRSSPPSPSPSPSPLTS
ncbi:MAG: SIS domain-containing protein [Ilumatobacter sp.]|uniref:SIS domain-containing protein n=1 Tax=Ilumatobacter sp. TaxID=1967498 RepID=UPI00391B0FB2